MSYWRPSPSTSSLSQILPLSSAASLEGSAACTIPYNRMPRDQLKNLARWLKRSHTQYLSNATDRQVCQLRTRALSTDTIAGSFAEINSSMGYKARPQQLEPRLRRLDLRWAIKHNLFNTMQSSRQYSLHSLAAASDAWLDDDTLLNHCKPMLI